MREITEIQKRLEKVSLDLKQSQDELRELSGKLAELERSLKLKLETANPINTEKSAIKQDTKKQTELYNVQDLKSFFDEDLFKLPNLLFQAFKNVENDVKSRGYLMYPTVSDTYIYILFSMLRFGISDESIIYCAEVNDITFYSKNQSFDSDIEYAISLDKDLLNNLAQSITKVSMQKDLITRMLDMVTFFDMEHKRAALLYIAGIAEAMGLSDTDVRESVAASKKGPRKNK